METRAQLKAYFETGDKPTQTQFASLIDSVPNIIDDSSEYTEIILKTDVTITASPQSIDILAADAASYFLVTELWYIILEKVGSSLDDTKYMSVGTDQSLPLNSIYSYGSGWIVEDLSTPIQINCDELPSGITTLRIRVLLRGYKVSKT